LLENKVLFFPIPKLLWIGKTTPTVLWNEASYPFSPLLFNKILVKKKDSTFIDEKLLQVLLDLTLFLYTLFGEPLLDIVPIFVLTLVNV